MFVDVLLDPFGATWDQMQRAAHGAEAQGWDGIWTWDHLSGAPHHAPDVLECWTILSAVAAVSSRVMLGPMVLNVANRDAGTLAVMAATLQQVSDGRLLLGLGAGGGADTPYAEEQTALGRSVPTDPVRRHSVAQTIETLRKTWDTPGFLRPDPRPPIIVGGFGPRMAELAGRYADGINVPAGLGLDRLVARARQARPQAGSDFIVTVSAGLDRRQALEDHGVDRMIVYAAPPYTRTISGYNP